MKDCKFPETEKEFENYIKELTEIYSRIKTIQSFTDMVQKLLNSTKHES